MKKISTILFLTLFSTLTFAQSVNSKSYVLGVIEEIQSTQLGEKRILNIYLPEGYEKNETIKYPVIYLLDGSAAEN